LEASQLKTPMGYPIFKLAAKTIFWITIFLFALYLFGKVQEEPLQNCYVNGITVQATQANCVELVRRSIPSPIPSPQPVQQPARRDPGIIECIPAIGGGGMCF